MKVASVAKPADESAKLGAEGARNPVFTANHSGPVCSKYHGIAAIWECGFTSTCASLPLMCLKPFILCSGDARIHTLNLSANNIGDKGAAALAEMLKVCAIHMACLLLASMNKTCCRCWHKADHW